MLFRLTGDLNFLCFQPWEVEPKNRPFFKIFLWSPIGEKCKNRHFRHLKKNDISLLMGCFFEAVFCIVQMYDSQAFDPH